MIGNTLALVMLFTHSTVRVMTPEPHVAEQLLRGPTLHAYEGQSGTAGHGPTVDVQLPSHRLALTIWPLCGTVLPPVCA